MMEHDRRIASEKLLAARILAPGGLIEEAALRRELFILDNETDPNAIRRIVGRYFSRFGRSAHVENFVERLETLTEQGWISRPPSNLQSPAAFALSTELEAAAEALTNPPDAAALGALLGRLVLARLDPLPERQVLARIKTGTGIPMAVLDKQIAELRRRLNATGDLSHRVIRPAWSQRLRLDLSGQPERNEANVITALTSDEAFAGAIVFDAFRQEIVVRRPLPWDAPGGPATRPWTDGDDVRAAEWLQRRELNVAPMIVSRSVGAVAREITVHPVRDHLDALAWDGVPRIETWVAAISAPRTRPSTAASARSG